MVIFIFKVCVVAFKIEVMIIFIYLFFKEYKNKIR